jgi:hypothetical protein
MVRVMKGLIPAPKGRVRTPVGHKYLEALQSKVNGEGRVRTPVGHKYLEALQSKVNGNYSDSASSPSSSAEGKEPGLNLLILGITSGTAMDDIDFALCRFTQEIPEAPLCLDIVQVFPSSLPQKTNFLPNATVRFRCHAFEDPN